VNASCDVAIVGAGLIGLGTALALSESGRHSVLVLEAEDRLAAHQSGRNSGVIHAGLYYRPESLKARICREGRDALYRFLGEEGIPHRRCGKLVVATSRGELEGLALLEARARANGLRELRRLEGAALRSVEPEVAGLAGLWVGETGVVDFATVAAAVGRRVERAGAEIRTGARVLRARPDGNALVVATTAGDIRARFLVNCAGLQADRVARACGTEPGVAIIPFRGDYYDLVSPRRELVRNLIYPVPDASLPFLGVHLTRTIDGRVEAGPNAVLALAREGYGRGRVSLRDVGATVGFPGFWRMAARHWRAGLVEEARSAIKGLTVRALRRLVPALRGDDLEPGGCGIRAQAVDSAGRLLDDFHIVTAERSLHVLNAPSPGATASLAIGRHVAGRVAEALAG